MASAKTYDAIVIGSGQAGTPLAMALAESGRRTALIEREHVGGTCINEGCTPTKTMVASGRVAYLARRAADYGVLAGPIGVDMRSVRQRKRDIVAGFRGGNERRLEGAANLDLLFGEASFTDPRTLDVRLTSGDMLSLAADEIYINAGARPGGLDIPGLADVPTLTSTTIMELDVVPDHLLVLGGGYIGVEFGQLFRRLGSRVSIIQRGAHLLAREDDDIAEAVADIMREDGIDVLLQTAPTRAARRDDGAIEFTVRTPRGDRTLIASHVLVAAGRVPNTDALQLPRAGVQTDTKGFIRTNERLETSVPGIWALGDIKGGPAFTHISYDDFRVIRANVIEGNGGRTTHRLLPYTVFIDPQLGRVGVTEQEAHEKGLNVRVAKMPMSYVARALELDEARGFMKAVIDADTGEILGAAVLGIEGGELMAIFEVAMLGKLPYTALRDAIFAHPTLAESLNNLFASLQAPMRAALPVAGAEARAS